LPFSDRADENAAFAPRVHTFELDPAKIADGPDWVAADLCLALWQVLLWKLTGQEAFQLGLCSTGRTYDELGDALGLFARDLPLACVLDGNPSLGELAASVHRRVEELQEWQEYFSWEHLSADTGSADTGEVPFFRLCFEWQDRSAEFAADGLSVSILHRVATTQRYKLKLVAARTVEGVVFELHYDSGRISEQEVGRLADLFAALVGSALDTTAGGGDRPIAELTLMPPGELERLATLNPSPVETRGGLIHAWIGETAAREADRPAILWEDESLSFAELERRAHQLANHLRSLGVGPEVRVGLCLERSPRMFIGILGILEAGGGYVPLDPNYPADRLAFMLEDSQAAVLVTESHLLDRLGDSPAAQAGPRILCLDRDAAEIERAGATAPSEQATPDNLAYVIYTSGSTGRPKGVEICHRHLVHSIAARGATYERPPRRYMLLSSFAFDSSVAGIFWTLCQGGALVLPLEGREREASELVKLIRRHGVTTTLALPSLYGLMLDAARAEPSALESLETVIVAGEACPPALVARHAEHMPGVRLFNEYGPTEACVWSSVAELKPRPDGRVTIGVPIQNAWLGVFDTQARPVPVGVPGELYIGGAGVARGYLGRPDVTAERFVSDPARPDRRLYRSGDRVRWLPDGNLEFLGRIDNQVKVRGYRIELEEIESAIGRHPAVAEASVVAREDVPGEARLVAYVVPAGGAELSTSELGQLLRRELPEYMIPSVFVTLDTLPRTPNGKVDRKRLPAPDHARPVLDTDYAQPSTPLEEALVDIWAEVLGIERVGVNDNFFELGGHSILAVRLVARMSEALQMEISLRSLFDAPTPASLLAALAADPAASKHLEQVGVLFGQLAALSDEEVETALEDRQAPPEAQ
jgi:amino acid adenylation domain-containing protein